MTPPAITLEKEDADKTSLVRKLSSALERKLTGRMKIRKGVAIFFKEKLPRPKSGNNVFT